MKSTIKKVSLFIGLAVAAVLAQDFYFHHEELALWQSLRNNVVKITDVAGGGGTGFVVEAPDGRKTVITNQHICDNNKILFINHGKHSHKVTVKKKDARVDSCELDTPQDVLDEFPTPLKLSKNLPSIGDRVFQGGHPGLRPFTPSSGYVVDLETIDLTFETDLNGRCPEGASKIKITTFFGLPMDVCVLKLREIFHTAPTFPGNSGSPILNEAGEVVGMTNIGTQTGMGGMIPVDDIRRFLHDQLP